MKNIAIVTINSLNYGNRLQNYALQTVLESLGYKTETIRRNVSENSLLYKLKNYAHYIWKPNYATQIFKFNKSIKWSKKVYESDLEDLNDSYDYFIVGSDQVWNPYFYFTGTDLDFLTFANTSRRIAYAASFGVSEIPDEKIIDFKNKLKNFKKISVRENAGAEIITKLSGARVPVVLDPTMLLTAEQWRGIEKRPHNMPKEKYTLVYCVESMSADVRKKVEEEKKKGLVLEVRKRNGKEWAVGPNEFLYLIDHAEKLITDSFHGTVFSILFHTPFVVCDRDDLNMYSRLDTLLKTFEIETEITEDMFLRAEIVLKKRRNESLQFLKNALEI